MSKGLHLKKQLGQQIKKALYLSVFLLGQESVVAAEYSIASNVQLTGRFDDNSRLSVGFKDELYGNVLASNLDFRRATEKSSLTAGLNLENNAYNIDAYSTFDQRIDLGYFRATEHGSWNIGGVASQDSTLDTELTSEGSGLFDLRDSRIRSDRLTFGWNRNLTDRHVLVWDAAANLVQYDNARRIDYKFGNTSLLWQYIVNERLRMQANASYNQLDSAAIVSDVITPIATDLFQDPRFTPAQVFELIQQCEGGLGFFDFNGVQPCFQPRQLDNEQSTTRFQLGVFYLISENLTLDALVGKSTVDTNRVETYANLPAIGSTTGTRINQQSGKNSGLTYTMDLSYSGENKESTLSASSVNSVNSNGVLVLTTSISLEGLWRLNAKHNVFGSITQFDQETSSDGVGVFNDRELATLILRYQYRFTEEWSASFLYRRDDQKRAIQDRRAESNEWTLTVAWRPTTLKWSR